MFVSCFLAWRLAVGGLGHFFEKKPVTPPNSIELNRSAAVLIVSRV
jgi:hypothetical protein